MSTVSQLFRASRPAPGTITKYVVDFQQDADNRLNGPAHVGMFTDNTQSGDMRHVCLSIRRERAVD